MRSPVPFELTFAKGFPRSPRRLCQSGQERDQIMNLATRRGAGGGSGIK